MPEQKDAGEMRFWTFVMSKKALSFHLDLLEHSWDSNTLF